jgi:hypothetical protein
MIPFSLLLEIVYMICVVHGVLLQYDLSKMVRCCSQYMTL